MLGHKLFEEMSFRIGETIAASPVKDIEKNLRSMMAATFGKLNLVTREEFDVQQEVLVRTREKLVALEERLARIEAAVFIDKAEEQIQCEVNQGHS